MGIIDGKQMKKVGRNDPCPCGSEKKYKKCCLDKKPRAQSVIVGSPEPLGGFQYDKGKMEVKGITLDGRVIDTAITFSQTQYTGASGKEKVISRVQDKVIPNEIDLLRHLSSFGLIVGVDTNTKVIGEKRISVAGVVHCVMEKATESDIYSVNFPWHGAILFKNCPSEMHPEKFSWLSVIKALHQSAINRSKQIALVTDHDLDNHISYNGKKVHVFGTSYLPDNITLIYGRGDGPTENILNHLIKQCDTKSSNILKEFEETGYCQIGTDRIRVDQIPVPMVSSSK